MSLQSGDWVRTPRDEIAKVVHISRLTVFVAVAAPEKTDHIEAFLESQLEKVEPPEDDAPG